MMDIELIKKYVPHRYPFLLVDRILDEKPGVSLIAIKNVSFNEPIFQGHFPDISIFPGVFILEAMAQASGILATLTTGRLSTTPDELYYFAGLDKVKFKKPVVPGDQLHMLIEFVQEKQNYMIFKTKGTATVNGEVVCMGEFLCAKKSKIGETPTIERDLI